MRIAGTCRRVIHILLVVRIIREKKMEVCDVEKAYRYIDVFRGWDLHIKCSLDRIADGATTAYLNFNE